jgi:hypothetical protein
MHAAAFSNDDEKPQISAEHGTADYLTRTRSLSPYTSLRPSTTEPLVPLHRCFCCCPVLLPLVDAFLCT